tara:strand:+ start:1322 stop:2362 length:1041 start_codon:yes stop_codon:yes gene_type:complete
MNKIKKNRSIRLIRKFIEELNLDLTDFQIITELGSNNYMLTPIIAVLAGAKKVITYTSDSVYGNSNEIIQSFLKNFPEQIFQERITAKEKLFSEDYQSIDIITNSRSLRPINRSKIKHLSKRTVIPLMYDRWEIREEDIDVQACSEKGIMIAGTNESASFFPIFEYCGLLAAKMSFDAGYEIRQNNILIWSKDEFGETIKKEFQALGANEVIMTTDFSEVEKKCDSLDFIFLTDYHEKRSFTEDNGFFNFKILKEKNQDIGIVHLYGKIDYSFCEKYDVNLFPKKDGYASKMSFTLDYLGLVPLVKLIIGSFKVAECLLKGIDNELVQPVNVLFNKDLKKYTNKKN